MENIVSDTVGGLIDIDLVRTVVGTAGIATRGPGAVSRTKRRLETAHVTVQDTDRGRTVMQVRAVEVDDPDSVRADLDAEAARSTACVARYTDDPGYGYGCTYDIGLYADGAAVHVLRGDRLIRVAVHDWPDATPDQRLALAEQVARNVDANLTAYDAATS